jgi:hypothetical protein
MVPYRLPYQDDVLFLIDKIKNNKQLTSFELRKVAMYMEELLDVIDDLRERDARRR